MENEADDVAATLVRLECNLDPAPYSEVVAHMGL